VLNSLWPDLSSAAPADSAWMPLVLTISSLIACAATAAVLVLSPALYKRHRHRLAVANRLLRAALAAWEAACGSPLLRQMVATRSKAAPLTALGVLQHESTAWHSMQRHLLKPLYVMSAVVMTPLSALLFHIHDCRPDVLCASFNPMLRRIRLTMACEQLWLPVCTTVSPCPVFRKPHAAPPVQHESCVCMPGVCLSLLRVAAWCCVLQLC
jgi:hypothetical protein